MAAAAPALPFLSALGAGLQFVGQMRRASALEDAAEQQRAAADEAARISNMNAARIEAETAEEARRERERAAEAQSQRRLVAAASGGTMTGSTAVFLDTQREREQSYLDWLERSGASRASITRTEGRLTQRRGIIESATTERRARSARTGAVGSLFDIYRGFTE